MRFRPSSGTSNIDGILFSVTDFDRFRNKSCSLFLLTSIRDFGGELSDRHRLKLIHGVVVKKKLTLFDVESHPHPDSFVLECFCQLLLRAFLQLFVRQRKLRHRPHRYLLLNQNTSCLLTDRNSPFLLLAALVMRPDFV